MSKAAKNCGEAPVSSREKSKAISVHQGWATHSLVVVDNATGEEFKTHVWFFEDIDSSKILTMDMSKADFRRALHHLSGLLSPKKDITE